ncbi:MAG: amidohydrolase family protein [Sphaerochaetaceae bacterium]
MDCADFVIGPGQRVIPDGAVVTDGCAILFVGERRECLQRYPDLKQCVHAHCVISPGFINAHMHMYGILAHGLSAPVPIGSFESFLKDYWWPLVENVLDVPMLEAATHICALELLDSGVTTVCDVLEAPNLAAEGLFCEAAILRGLHMRCVLSIEASERISTENGLECLHGNAGFLQSCLSDPLVSSMLCLHTAFTCSQAFISQAQRLAEHLGCAIQLHLNESTYEPTWCRNHHHLRTALWYDRIGLLTERLLAAQCVQLSIREIDLLAQKKVRCVHVPLSNCEVGGGIAPIPRLLERGITVGLGTDGYINDFFEVMRSAFLIHKGHNQTAEVMCAPQVWKMATQDGARAVFGDRAPVGALEPGKQADFQIISIADIPTEVTPLNLFDQLILRRKPQHVIGLCIAGNWVKKNGQLVVGNLADAQERCRNESLRLKNRGIELAAY